MPVRLATQSDIDIVGRIAYRAFQYSNMWPWLRPHSQQYPEDAQRAYCQEYQQALYNERKRFTVPRFGLMTDSGCRACLVH